MPLRDKLTPIYTTNEQESRLNTEHVEDISLLVPDLQVA